MGNATGPMSGRIRLTPTEGSYFTACAPSAELGILVTGEMNGVVRVWNMPNTSAPTSLQTHISSAILFLSFLGEGNDTLAVVNQNGVVREFKLWKNTCQLSGRSSIQFRLLRESSVDSHISLPSGMFHPRELQRHGDGEIESLLKLHVRSLRSLEAAMKSGNTKLIKKCFDHINSHPTTFPEGAALAKKNLRHLAEDTEALKKVLDEGVLVAEVCRIQLPQSTLRHQPVAVEAFLIETENTILNMMQSCILEPLVQDTAPQSIHIAEPAMVDDSGHNLDTRLSCISIEDACKVGMGGVIRKLLLGGVPPALFRSNTINWIVEYKWHKIHQPISRRELTEHFFFFILLTIYFFLLLGSDWPLLSSFEGIVATVLWVGLILFSFREWRRELLGIKCYARDSSIYSLDIWRRSYRFLTIGSTALDVFSVLLLTIAILLHFFSFCSFTTENWLRCFAPIAYITACLKGIHLLLPYRAWNLSARMILDFLSIMPIFIVGVAAVLAVSGFAVRMFLGPTITEGSKCIGVVNALGSTTTNTTIFVSVFLGGLDVEEFYCDKNRALFFVVLLIAIASAVVYGTHVLGLVIGDRFKQLQHEKEQQLTRSRAEAIDVYESKLSDTERQEIDAKIGKFLFVLVSTEESPSTRPYSLRP